MTPEESAALFAGATLAKRAEVLMKAGCIPVESMPYVLAHLSAAVLEERARCVKTCAKVLSQHGHRPQSKTMIACITALQQEADP